MKMRQSQAELEQAFAQEISLERRRRHSLLHTSAKRTMKREVDKRHRQGSMRFLLLIFTLLMTAAIVAVVMFRTLYLLLS